MINLTGKAWAALMCVLAVTSLAIFGYCIYKEQTKPAETQVVAPAQALSSDFLENHFKLPSNQTKETVKYVEKAQSGAQRPAATVIVQAPSADDAAQQVARRIKEQDETLPAAAIKKSDRTVVTVQPQNKEHDVGVYKINLRKDHKVKVGATYVNDVAYWTAGYQNRRVEYNVVMKEKELKGAGVTYTLAEW